MVTGQCFGCSGTGAFVLRWRHDHDDHTDYISIFQYDSKNGTNLTHNNDAGYDAIYDKYKTSATTADAQKTYQEANNYYLQKHWVIQLPATISYTVYQPYLMGYSGQSMAGMGYTWYWKHLWIDSKAKAAMGR